MKKKVSLITILATILALASLPLPAASSRKGSTVEVTMADGKKVTGELLAVKCDSLLIFDEDSGRGEDLDLQQVILVKVHRKSRVLRGFALGMGAGIVSGFMIPHARDEYGIITHVFLPVVISALGGIIGNQGSIPKRFALAGASPLVRQSKLEWLGRYAREQSVGKQAGLQ